MSVIDQSEPDRPRPGVNYRGQNHWGKKGFFRGTQRSIAPEQTLARVRPCFPIAGITRLANITHLDRIGVPTTLAIRPNGQTLSNSSGKGFSLEAAMASGAMEAIELFHAEEFEPESLRLSYDDIPDHYQRIPVEGLPIRRHAPFSKSWPFFWCEGWDILNQCPTLVPTALVKMGNGEAMFRSLFAFQVTSNGLASGNNLLEAINAALFEVIERDAVTAHRVRWDLTGEPPPVVIPASIEFPLVRDLIHRLDEAAVTLVLFDCTVDTDVPVYMAYIIDQVWQNFGVFKGYGCHLDPEIAMVRAITEAVQSRVIYVAGSRDDLFRHDQVHLKASVNDHAARVLLETMLPTVDASKHPSEATDSFDGDTLLALDKLEHAGLDQVIVVDLGRADFPMINVVKVIVPGLEGYKFDFYEPGRRALAFARGARP